MRKILKESFFNRDTKIVAKELLGKFLIRKIADKEIATIITETEAYDGPYDLASHAFKGRTLRTEVMFGNPGKLYVYLCYGMHFMLNVVTREQGYPAAVLIRGVKLKEQIRHNQFARWQMVWSQVKKEVTPIVKKSWSLDGKAIGTKKKIHLDGPGKITKFLHIDQSLNNKMAKKSTNLWFEDRGVKIPKFKIKKLDRIGVDYAGHFWSSKKLRFALEM